MSATFRYRNLLMILAGVAGLVLKRWLARWLGDPALSYAGNLSASFAVYFLAWMVPLRGLTRVMAAGLALVVVEAFELTDGFGVMSNVYDPYDYLANAIGIALAVCVDVASSRIPGARAGTAATGRPL